MFIFVVVMICTSILLMVRGLGDWEFYGITMVLIGILIITVVERTTPDKIERFVDVVGQEEKVGQVGQVGQEGQVRQEGQEGQEEEVNQEEGNHVGEETLSMTINSTRFLPFDFSSYKRLFKMPSEIKGMIIPNMDRAFAFMTVGAEDKDMEDGQHIADDEKYEIDSQYFEEKGDPAVMKNGMLDEEAFGDLTSKYLDCNFALYNLKMWLPDVYKKVVKA